MDRNNIVQLLAVLWPEKTEQIQKTADNILDFQNNPDYRIELLFEDGNPCALAVAHVADDIVEGAQGIVEIDIVVVGNAFQGKGYGSQLLKKVEQFAKEKNCRYVRVESGIYREGAHAFYKKQGFVLRDYTFYKDIT